MNNDFSLINATVDWCNGPRFDLLDEKYPVYALNFNQFIDNKWCSIHEHCEFKPFYYYKSNFTSRIKWKIKAWAFQENIVQVFEETYDETNKNICLQLNNDNYKSHELWFDKSVKLSRECNFNLFIISKFADRLQKNFFNFPVEIHSHIDSFDDFKKSENIYANYVIDRKEILTKTANWWETNKIFINHSKIFASWDHQQDWIGMNDEQIYNNIMDI